MSFLHDIWNPWHGCVKCSEGCQNCYMYFLDRMRDQNGAEIYNCLLYTSIRCPRRAATSSPGAFLFRYLFRKGKSGYTENGNSEFMEVRHYGIQTLWR